MTQTFYNLRIGLTMDGTVPLPNMHPIDQQFDANFANALAKLESYNKHLYRPNSYLHKWWARRCGSTFRTILKHLVPDKNQQGYYEPGGLDGKIILDPMMGGGTTLHEAIRLGANVIGADIDPIPVLQARASLADLPLATLRAGFDPFFAQAAKPIAPLFETSCPHCETNVPQRYTLYGWRQRCDCGEALFVDSLTLRHNSDGSTIHICPITHNVCHDEHRISQASKGEKLPIFPRKQKVCSTCAKPYQEDLAKPYFRRYVPLVVVGKCPTHKLFMRAMGEAEWARWQQAERARADIDWQTAVFQIPTGPKSNSLHVRGIHNYLDLFSSRQLLFLQAAANALPNDNPLVRLNLALLLSTALEFNSLLCGYKGVGKRRSGAIKHTFVRHAYSFPYTALENNPVYPQRSSGGLQNLFQSRIVRGRNWANKPIERRVVNGKAEKVDIVDEQDMGVETAVYHDLTQESNKPCFLLLHGSSSQLALPDKSVHFIVTDPPYFDSVQYSDLSHFFRVWLRQFVPEAANWDVALEETAVDQRQSFSADAQYRDVLGSIFAECHRVLKPESGRFIFTFHHWNPKAWAALTIALKRGQFQLVNRYVVHAENLNSLHIAQQKALLHDVILVLAAEEAGVRGKWKRPLGINQRDSEIFCRDCGTLLGWLLATRASEDAITAEWTRLLA